MSRKGGRRECAGFDLIVRDVGRSQQLGDEASVGVASASVLVDDDSLDVRSAYRAFGGRLRLRLSGVVPVRQTEDDGNTMLLTGLFDELDGQVRGTVAQCRSRDYDSGEGIRQNGHEADGDAEAPRRERAMRS